MNNILCPVCLNPLSIRTARGRTSNKPFIMLVCPKDGRHFRAFITDQDYIKNVLKGNTEFNQDSQGSGSGLYEG
jgi:hypothetical protein